LGRAGKVGPTELPHTVAGFHSLVGLAAMLAAIGEFFELGGKTAAAVYLATFIGGITFTGSLVAFGKLSQMLGSSPLKLPGRDLLNLSGLGIGILGLAAFIDPNLVGNLVGGGGGEEIRMIVEGGVRKTSIRASEAKRSELVTISVCVQTRNICEPLLTPSTFFARRS